jgi:thiamine-phosphate pyrophosphorylase
MRLSRDRPIICLITSGNAGPESFQKYSSSLIDLIPAAVTAGVSLFQVREKRLSATLLFTLARSIVTAAKGTAIQVIVNDRLDVAIAAEAAGVHLPSDSFDVEDVRQAVHEDFVIGVSTHNDRELLHAREAGADYAFFGPVFPTPNKAPAVGVGGLSRAVSSVTNLPVLGLGGITPTNYREILDTGAAGFAAIRSLNDPAQLRLLAETEI